MNAGTAPLLVVGDMVVGEITTKETEGVTVAPGDVVQPTTTDRERMDLSRDQDFNFSQGLSREKTSPPLVMSV